MRYQQGLPWDDTGVRLGLSALAALHGGATALETSIVNAVSSAMHVEDLLSYIRTGESRSELIQRLTSGPAAPSGELLRAWRMARTTGSPAESLAASTLEALSSAGRDLPNMEPPGVTTGNVRSSSRSVAVQTEATAGIERQLAQYRDVTYRALLGQLPTREPRRYCTT